MPYLLVELTTADAVKAAGRNVVAHSEPASGSPCLVSPPQAFGVAYGTAPVIASPLSDSQTVGGVSIPYSRHSPSLPVYAYPGAAPEEANGISQAIWQPSPDGRMRGRKAYSSHARAQASGPYATFQNECCSAARSQSKRAALYAPVAPGYPGLSEYSQQGLAAAGVSPMRMLRPFDAHLSTPAEVATMGTQQTASNLSSPRTISAYGPTYCAPAYVGGNSIEMQSAYNLMATQTPLLPAYVFHGSPSDTAHPLDGSPSDLAQPLDHRGMRMTPQVFTLTCSEQRPLRVVWSRTICICLAGSWE